MGGSNLDALSRLRALAVTLSCGLAIGMLLCPKLWLSLRSYPTAPVLQLPLGASLTLELLSLAVLLCGLILLAIRPGLIPGVLIAGALTLLCLLDQSRLQPWALQYGILLLVIAACIRKPEQWRSDGLALCGLVMAGTYFWSGVQKFNPVFRSDVFPWFSQPLAHWVGMSALPYWLGYACPLAEISIALGLLWPRTRTLALAGVLGIHIFALLMLGPLGQNWNSVVWPWNLAQAIAAVLIFWRNPVSLRMMTLGQQRSVVRALATATCCVLPGLSFLGLWDSYPSMALYSGNVARGWVYLDAESVDDLPESAQLHCRTCLAGTELELQDWSFAELNAPAYPEPRIFIAVARKIQRRADPKAQIELHILTRPTLFDPARRVRYDPSVIGSALR